MSDEGFSLLPSAPVQADELFAPATHLVRERRRPAGAVCYVDHLGSEPNQGLASAGFSPAQTSGRRYEARVGRWLESRAAALGLELYKQHWFKYRLEGQKETRLCQPDFILTDSKSTRALIGECKQTWTDTSIQLSLYARVLAFEGFDPVPFTICRNLTPAVDRDLIVRKLEDVKEGSILVLRI